MILFILSFYFSFRISLCLHFFEGGIGKNKRKTEAEILQQARDSNTELFNVDGPTYGEGDLSPLDIIIAASFGHINTCLIAAAVIIF